VCLTLDNCLSKAFVVPKISLESPKTTLIYIALKECAEREFGALGILMLIIKTSTNAFGIFLYEICFYNLFSFLEPIFLSNIHTFWFIAMYSTFFLSLYAFTPRHTLHKSTTRPSQGDLDLSTILARVCISLMPCVNKTETTFTK
jgi:hypothetical protein